MGYQTKKCVVINVADLKNIRTMNKFPHPDSVYGVCWSNFNANQFITASMDAKVRLFEIGSSKPIREFIGHDKRVFHVIFNPLLPNIIASGSDDLTVRVWDIT